MPTNRTRFLGAVGLVVTVGLAAGSAAAYAPATGSRLAADSAQASSKIAFMSDRDGGFEVYVMNADGSGQRNLTRHPGPDNRAHTLSPDGRRIAFVTRRDGNNEVYVVNVDGSGQRNLTRNAANDGSPAWSPDGRRIAFVSVRDGNPEIYVMNADGTGQRRLTRNAARGRRDRIRDAGSDGGPVWSPDGQKIAFESKRDGNFEVYVMNADGSGQRNLTRDPAPDFGPVWSPDGRKIVFVSNRDGSSEVYVMNADGTGLRNLTRNPASDVWAGGPVWSPDGRSVAFVRSFVSGREGGSDVYVMNADGSGQRRLARGKRISPTTDWFLLTGVSPAWSPDGRRISFVSNRDGNLEVYVMNADGSGQRNLTRNAASDFAPVWSPGRTS